LKIVLVRVDDRLIHGQVAVGWTRTIGASHIVVANDEVAKDNTQKMLLKMATPVGVKSTILSVDEAAALLAAEKFGNDKVLVLVRDPKSLLRLIEGGVKFDKVNIGNVRMIDGRQRITKEVAATSEEIEDWKQLDQAGIKLEALWIPGGSATNFNEVIRKQR
jgi:mannose/fructose/N-acetylgalactosamine-specific phosphotransferase system component IIB